MYYITWTFDHWDTIIQTALIIVGAASTLTKVFPHENANRFLDETTNLLHKLALNPKKDKARL